VPPLNLDDTNAFRQSRSVGLSYKQHPPQGPFDAIVIGSGIGGLTAAALLARFGERRVLVLERHYTAGGFTHAFHRPGYEWDVGVHYIGQVQAGEPLRAIFDSITDGTLHWHAVPDVYDRIILDGREYEFVSGRERFRERMKEYFPEERKAIDQYLETVRRAARSTPMYFAEKALPPVVAPLAGGLLRARFLHYARRTTAEILRGITANRELTAVLTGQWGDYGLPPARSSFAMHAIIADHYFEGAGYPVGGAAQIARGIAPAIEKAGGQILVSAEVSRILVDGRNRAIGVRMADGNEVRAGLVISDAGASNTFERLLPPEAQGTAGLVQELKQIPPSAAHFCLYAGLRHSAAELSLSGTNIWVFPGPDHDGNVARFTASPDQPFPVLFISFPSAKDPEFELRHPGRCTIEVVALAPYEWFARWAGTAWKRRGAEYDELKESFRRRMVSELERCVPAARGRIDYAELSTPLSTRNFANYEHGEIYGLSASPERFQLRRLRPRTPVGNLYLTGQDVCTAGVAGGLFGGILAASAVLGRNLLPLLSGSSRGK
jgi:all-trans-retinol 13,14-reductase